MVAPVPVRASAQALMGHVIAGRYRIDGVIASGGMGTVYRAHHLSLRRDVAIKILHPELFFDENSRKRFEREAHSASVLDHPNCVRVQEHGQDLEGVVYIVMDLLEGQMLESALGQPMEVERALTIAIQILDGLDHAHHHQLIHRDLKPENVLLTLDFRGREVAKIVDFGIAKLLEGDDNRERLTRTGFVFGTPTYMSPEQALGQAISAQTDLYAFGLIFYEMVAGHPPFCAPDNGSLMRMQVSATPPALPREVDPELAEVIMRLLAKEPGDRPSGAHAVAEQLDGIRQRLRDPLYQLGQGGRDNRHLASGSSSDVRAVLATPLRTAPQSRPAPGGRRGSGARWLIAGVVALGVGAVVVGAVFVGGYVPLSRERDSTVEAVAASVSGTALPNLEDLDAQPPEGDARDADEAKAAGLGGLDSEGEAFTPTSAPAPDSGDDLEQLPESKEPALAAGLAAEPAAAALDDRSAPIHLTLQTEVDAQVLDAIDGAIYGRSNAPIEFDWSDQAIHLVLRAPGYRDLALQVTPNRDRVLAPRLERLGGSAGKKRRPAPGAPVADEPPKPTPLADPVPPPPEAKNEAKNEPKGSPDLNNPFSK